MNINLSNIVAKSVLAAVEKAMSSTDRRLFKAGNCVAFVEVERTKPLYRWGKKCSFTLTTPYGTLGRNSLVGCAWSYDADEAWLEAKQALNFFVWGDKTEYKISVTVVENGDHPAFHWATPVTRETAEQLMSEAYGSHAEFCGTDCILISSPTDRILEYEVDEGTIQYDLDNLTSRWKGRQPGCEWTEWE